MQSSFAMINYRILYIMRRFHTRMHFRMQVAIIAFAVSTIAIAPTLISSQPALAISKCEDDKGKSHSWYTGCRDGWYEWDVCGIYAAAKPPVSQYDRGYEVGWKKGQQHNPTGGPNDCK